MCAIDCPSFNPFLPSILFEFSTNTFLYITPPSTLWISSKKYHFGYCLGRSRRNVKKIIKCNSNSGAKFNSGVDTLVDNLVNFFANQQFPKHFLFQGVYVCCHIVLCKFVVRQFSLLLQHIYAHSDGLQISK